MKCGKLYHIRIALMNLFVDLCSAEINVRPEPNRKGQRPATA